MKIFLISDNYDMYIGFRLVGIAGMVVKNTEKLDTQIEEVIKEENIGILLISQKLCKTSPKLIDDIKDNRRFPLVVEIPDRKIEVR